MSGHTGTQHTGVTASMNIPVKSPEPVSRATSVMTDDLGFLSSATHSIGGDTDTLYSIDTASIRVLPESDISDTQIVGREILESRDKFTLYKISVTSKGKIYVIHRRFADFVQLNKRLRKQFPLFHLQIPPKRFWRNNFNKEFIAKREQGLHEFMQNILAHREVSRSSPVKRFFRVDNPPGPYEDLQTCILYNAAQEEKIRSLQCMLYNKEDEIAGLQQELQQIQSGAEYHRRSSICLQETQIQQLQQSEQKIKRLESKVTEVEEKHRQTVKELENYKKQHLEERTIEKQARCQEKDVRDSEVETKMREYDDLLSDIRQQIDTQLRTCEFPNVNVNIRGPSFEVTTTEIKPGQLRKLKEDIDYLDVMMRRYNRATLEAMEHELVEMKSDLAGKDHKLNTLDSELKKYRTELNNLSLRCQVDIMNKTKRLEDFEQENTKFKEYILYLEKHYFNSLVLGIKLAQRGRRVGLANITSSQMLYDKQRMDRVRVQQWPQWIASELCLPNSHSPQTGTHRPTAPNMGISSV